MPLFPLSFNELYSVMLAKWDSCHYVNSLIGYADGVNRYLIRCTRNWVEHEGGWCSRLCDVN